MAPDHLIRGLFFVRYLCYILFVLNVKKNERQCNYGIYLK